LPRRATAGKTSSSIIFNRWLAVPSSLSAINHPTFIIQNFRSPRPLTSVIPQRDFIIWLDHGLYIAVDFTTQGRNMLTFVVRLV
jgi:hypothetical protein